MDIQKDLSYNQFLALLLIYCSYADCKLKKKEKEYIRSKVSQSDYKIIHDYYTKSSDYDVIQTILKYKRKYYSTVKEQEKLFAEMKNLFLCDNDYSHIEEEIYNAITALLRGTEK
ncbi:MAG: hypothetical protein JW917_03245 [Ignavibacteria bacterium]|nr:hypothetical protein [Ignavibacteria bacterium]